MTADLLLEFASSLLAVAVGAFLGAWFAFRWEIKRREQDKYRAEILAGTQVLLELTTQLNRLLGIRQYANVHATSPNRWRHLPPLVPVPRSLHLNRGSLQFLLASSTPHVIEALSIADDQYASTLGVLEQRNQTMAEFQSRAAAVIRTGVTLTDGSEMEVQIGRDIVDQLQALSDGLYDILDLAISSNHKVFKGLRAQLKNLFPNERFPNRSELPEKLDSLVERQ